MEIMLAIRETIPCPPYLRLKKDLLTTKGVTECRVIGPARDREIDGFATDKMLERQRNLSEKKRERKSGEKTIDDIFSGDDVLVSAG
ncbi:hypothetical protein TIFTF001_030227 [Ficus carica]|uniref:Uncharacterized protein n=1 Tax=Ficus carica TaxID=3494 RepID=A0AA88DSU0_FICCA|nr:hypothetical protein TIFTF001_030227 [Ficus carica]